MSKSAFPHINVNKNDAGISERLYIATQIVSAIFSNPSVNRDRTDEEIVASAYVIADELIKQDKIK